MPRLAGLTVIALMVSAAAGCATMSVSSHVERGLDFARYRTYDWGTPDELPTGDPRLDRNPFFKDQVQGEVEKALAGVGYVTGDPERAVPSAGPAAPRHTAALSGTLTFAHEPPAWEGRPLWPCPGFDVPAIPEN